MDNIERASLYTENNGISKTNNSTMLSLKMNNIYPIQSIPNLSIRALADISQNSSSMMVAVDNVYSLKILAEVYGLPYSVNFHQLVYYSLLDPKELLKLATVNGDFRVACITVSRTKMTLDDYNGILVLAAGGGHWGIVNTMIYLGANNYSGAMITASTGGFTQIVTQMIQLEYAEDVLHNRTITSIHQSFNRAMAEASRWGHRDIVNIMIDMGADNYNWAMAAAANGGHDDIVDQMMILGGNSYNWTMASAASGGHQKIVSRMLEFEADCYDWAMTNAATYGHINIVDQMIKLGATDYESAMEKADKYGHKHIVDHMVDIGASLNIQKQ